MSSFTTFKVPSVLPQDLLLIQDLVKQEETFTQTPLPPTSVSRDDLDCIESSGGEEAGSEEEVEANLLTNDNEVDKPQTLPVSSDSETDDSSVSDDSDNESMKHISRGAADENDDEDAPTHASTTYGKTQNEVIEDEVVVPDISEVDPHEPLEQVGEIINILNNKIVIVKGIASQISDRASEKALDSDTLLVFEDRKVMGFIYETFGPTYQPLYQVRFSGKFPLDLERARISRPVFHVPHRSKFVFVSQLQQHKGSDASNAHDEEPGEDEVEFSDDEQEAAHKRFRREVRSESREAFSRQGTPSASRRRDQTFFDDSFGRHNPYDEHGPYDMDYDAGPSRPPPVPYDDPYSDLYNDSSTSGEPAIYAAAVDPTITDDTTSHNVGQLGGSTDDARPSVHNNRPPRGRGRGRGRLVPDRGRRRGRGRGRHPAGAGFSHGGRNAGLESPSEYSSSGQDHAFPPTPHYPQQPQLLPQFASPPPSPANWSYLDSSHQFSRQDFNIALQNQYGGVQPHINPRFANQLGFNFAHLPEQQTPYFGSATGPGQWHGESRDDMGDSGG